MNKKIKFISCLAIILSLSAWCSSAFADEITGTLTAGTNNSEATGTLTTGLTGNAGGVTGVVVVSPTASPAAGTYTSAQSVTLNASGASNIIYTTDGSTPTCSAGNGYSGAISVGSSETIQAISCYAGNAASAVASFPYVINIPAVVTPSVVTSGGGGGGGGGGYYDPYTVTIDGGATSTVSQRNVSLTTIAGMNQMWISNSPAFATSTGTGGLRSKRLSVDIVACIGQSNSVRGVRKREHDDSCGDPRGGITLTGGGEVLGASTTNSVANYLSSNSKISTNSSLRLKLRSMLVRSPSVRICRKGMTESRCEKPSDCIDYAIPLTQVAQTGAGSPNKQKHPISATQQRTR